jgi:hypothetical protein
MVTVCVCLFNYVLVKIRPRHISNTAIFTGYGIHEYLVMFFGLTDAPAYFMYLMNSVFISRHDKFVVIFIDNIFIYSKNKEDQHLGDHQLYVKFSKCEF